MRSPIETILNIRKYLNILLSPLRAALLKLRGVQCESGILVLGKPHVEISNGTISVGTKTRLVSAQANHEIGLSSPVVLTAKHGGHITIGENCAINGATIRAYGSVTLGNNVWVTAGCYILDADGHPMEASKRAGSAANETHARPVNIGDFVWLGIGCKILPGVTIGEGAVIGAGSVVTNDVPAYSLATGVPAKVIKDLKH